MLSEVNNGTTVGQGAKRDEEAVCAHGVHSNRESFDAAKFDKTKEKVMNKEGAFREIGNMEMLP